MVVFDGIVRVLLLSGMVFAAIVFVEANAVESNVMLPAPELAALSSASRRLHVSELVVVPGVGCTAQFVPAPESSFAVLTTRVGANCAVTLSGPFKVIVVLAEVALATGSPADVQPTNV